MNESSIKVKGGSLFCRYTDIFPERETLLFLHGLGESGLCFGEAFQECALDKYNRIVPDLLGYGQSSREADADYSFSAQIERLVTLLDHLQVRQVHLIGHSMGGDIGTKFCMQKADRVLSFVNIEGDLTPYDRFITEEAVKAGRKGHFLEWFEKDYCGGLVLRWSQKWPSCSRYAASLAMCSPVAFLENAREIYRLNDAIPSGYCAWIGRDYQMLTLPKVYFWGMESLSEGSRNFLANYQLKNLPFERAFHWVMLDQTHAFYLYLADFLTDCLRE